MKLALASRSLGQGEMVLMRLVYGILRMVCCTLAQNMHGVWEITNKKSLHGHCL